MFAPCAGLWHDYLAMPSPATTELRVSGMTCNNCARHVTEAIQSVPRVRSAMVSLEASRATVRWESADPGSVPAVLRAVAAAGYEAREVSAGDVGGAGPRSGRWQWNLIIGLGVTGILMAGEWVLGLATARWFQWLAFALGGVVQVFCGAQFYSGAWRQLKAGCSNMDTLVALGSTTAFGYSVWALLAGAGGHVYFMEAAAIISLVSLGHWLEARISDRASSALQSLLRLAPQTARKLLAAGDNQGSSRREEAPSEFRRTKFEPPHVGCYEVHREPRPPKLDALWDHEPKTVHGKDRLNLKTLSFSPSAIGERQTAVETEVPVASLEAGDRVALRPGDRIPVDGVVLEGESFVDESMLTGESAPADKKTGTEVFAGTVNLNGRLVMRVTATGEATALAHIVAAVQRAQTSRANIQRLGDRVSNIFVPVIVAVALAAGLWWRLAPASASQVHATLAVFLWHAHVPGGLAAGFIVAAAVLIIACPCAMGLATPAAIMASANAAARRGILIRDGVALEKAGTITAVVFDKTGTLTAGTPAVAEVWQSDGAAPPPLALALALTRHSNHPISHSIAVFCANAASHPSPGITVSDWREIRGSGIEARAATGDSRPETGRQPALYLGSIRWLREMGADLASGEKFMAGWSAQGATVVGLAMESKLLALFAVRDAVKPHSAEVIAQLLRQGLKIYLLTGDNSQTAAAIAKQAGIARDNVFAEVRPEQKAEFIKKLQARGARVAFVGDGINDAPALAQADLGIAVSRASDIAREAADVILLKSDIEAVPEALGLARAALRIIKQNLFWAFFYNALGVPLAALGFVSPVFCAAAMGASDLVVIGNALRLLRWRQPKS
jgi:Cu+-exporting ATPase